MNPTVLIEQYKNVCTHYDQLRYQHEEGLIPDDLYTKELDIILNYLQGIHEQLEQAVGEVKLQEEQ